MRRDRGRASGWLNSFNYTASGEERKITMMSYMGLFIAKKIIDSKAQG